MDLLAGKTLINKSGDKVSADETLGNVELIGFYFSAHWCPPCRAFTPILAEFYTELKDKGEKMEIIFVSSDRSLPEMMAYLKDEHGDWLAIPFNDPMVRELNQKFNIQGIPTLVVVKRDGTIITTDGRSEIYKNGTSCYGVWSKTN